MSIKPKRFPDYTRTALFSGDDEGGFGESSNELLTNANPDRNVPPASQITNEDYSNHIANLIAGGNQPGQARWNIESLLYCRYDRINVPWA